MSHPEMRYATKNVIGKERNVATHGVIFILNITWIYDISLLLRESGVG